MKKSALAFLAFTFMQVAAFSSKPDNAHFLNSQPMRIFVLTGQSNISGFASVPTRQYVSNNVYAWSNGWELAIEPIHKNNYMGPALAFALALQDLYGLDYPIGIIPCAVSGSTIEQWQKGQPIYQDCVVKTNAALSTQPAGTFISGLILAQGEANTYTQQSADGWVSLTLQFARDFRTDTGKLTVPFIYAQLGPDPLLPTHPYWTYLQTRQSTLQNPSVYPYIRMAKTLDLPAIDQHFTSAGYDILGKRLAAIYYSNFGQ